MTDNPGQQPNGGSADSPRRRRRRVVRPGTGEVDPVAGDDVPPNPSNDEQDVGWGELPRERDDWYERERPPHHGT